MKIFEEIFMKKITKAIAHIFVVAAVVFAAGCAQKTATPINETITPRNGTITPVNGTLENGQVITENYSGKVITLKKGENFTLILRETEYDGGWYWDFNVSSGLSILSNYFKPDYTTDKNGQPIAGSPGNCICIIQAMSAGDQQVNGKYKRSWESNPGIDRNFTLSVKVI
jgi:inhibitor of cysteine peptidase